MIIYITHVSFVALKSGFEVVLVNDATSHGIRKSQLVISKPLRKDPCVWSLRLSFPIFIALVYPHILTHIINSRTPVLVSSLITVTVQPH